MKFLELNTAGKDIEAIKEYLNYLTFKKFTTITDKFAWFIDEGLYVDFYQNYSQQFVNTLINKVYNYKFTFTSFTQCYIFYGLYALKSPDKKIVYETYEDRIIACVLYLAKGNEKLALDLAEEIISQRYQPATPTFLNAGKKQRGEFVSCFLLELEDSLNSILDVYSKAGQLSKMGGGVAIDLSNLRARNDPIKDIKNCSKGIVPVMKMMENLFNYADQMGQRKGAGVTYLNIFHKDVVDFLDTKKINADEKSRIQSLSLGLIIPSKFIELAQKNKPFYVFSPYDVQKEYGLHFIDVDWDKYYDEFIANNNITKKSLNARKLLIKIAEIQFESGYPYLIYADNANKVNPLKAVGTIKMSNLCTEIHQVQTSSYISDDNTNDKLGYDVNCVLGSLNIVNVMQNKDIEKSVKVAIDALTKVTELTNIKNANTVKRANDLFHSVGLGAMNLHGFLALNQIHYDSVEAKDFCNIFFMMMNYYSLDRSMEIAKEKGESFYGFEKSEYNNEKYFKKYIEADFTPSTTKVKDIFKDIKIPNKNDWHELKLLIKQHGLYNSYRLAIAPTGKISYLQSATASILPIIDVVETRTYADSISYYTIPYYNQETKEYYKSAYEIDQYKILDLIAVIQSHIDQGISCTLHIYNTMSTKDLAKLYLYAHKKGLKSLYYTRVNNKSLEEECEACAI